MILDMRTIVFSYILTDIACLVIIVLLWQQTRRRFAGTGFFVFDFAFQLTALCLVVLRGQIPDWISMVLSNTLAMIGALLGYMGLLRFVGKKSSQIHNYILLTAFVCIHAYFALVQPNLAARNLNISIVMLIICFQCAWLMLYRVAPGGRQLTRFVGVVLTSFCVISVIRIGEFFTGAPLTGDYLHAGIFEQFVLISYQMFFILLTYSLMLMFNKRLLSDITMQEEKFSKAFHSSPYAVTITRMSDGKIIEVNESFFRITGYQLADIQGETTINLNLWNNAEDRAFVVSELTGKGKIRESEFHFRKKSGEIITGWFSANTLALNNEMCVLSSINDITSLKLAEVNLRESEATKSVLSERLNDSQKVGMIGSWEWNLQNNTVWWSEETYEIFGVTPQDFVPSFEANGKFIHPDDFADYVRLFKHSLQTHELLNTYFRLISKDEKQKYCQVRGKVILGDSGQKIRFIGTVMDITERWHIEQENIRLKVKLENKVISQTRKLRETQLALLNLVDDLNQGAAKITSVNQSLESVNKELAAFSYSVSHDLRAPLRSIDGFSNALLEDCQDKLDAAGKSYLARIRRATQNMARLIDDMLNLAKVTQSAFTLEQVDLSILVQTLVKDIRQHDPARSVDIIIAGKVVGCCDKRLMKIALTNLLDNAWKFTGKEQQPKIEFGSMIAGGKTVMFLRDNGVGFDMAYRDNIFGAFQRLHRTDEFPGTGIGLATVQRIINRHKGRIWAEGEVGKGATFYFTLEE